MSTRIRIVHTADKVFNFVVCTILALVLLFGCYSIWDTYKVINGGGNGSDLTHFKPDEADPTHPSLAELMKQNPDVKAWLTISDTGIDYPVCQGKDNFEYLTKDALGQYSLTGSLFLDYQCDPEFKAPYELIHGHHMVDSMMFGDLAQFEEEDYFNSHKKGYLMTVDDTYDLEIFACLHIGAKDPYVYNTYKTSTAFNKVLLKHISDKALLSRNIGVTENDQILAMSTCANGQTNDRTVVFARMVKR